MKIKNTKAINEKILSCVEQREYDRFISAAFVLPISSGAMRFGDEKKLKELADRMQDPSTGLEESIRCYEEGMHYYRICTDILHDAKQQIETYRIGPEETDR